MRFYFGFSKRIPFKWILIAIGVVLAFFGITKVHALEISNYNLETTWFYQNNVQNVKVEFSDTDGDINFNSNLMFDNYFLNSVPNRYAFFYVSSYYYSGYVSQSNIPNNIFYNSYLYNYRVRLITSSVWISCITQDNVIICPLSTDSNLQYLGLNFSGSFIDKIQNINQTASLQVDLAAYTDIYSTTDNQAIIDNNNQNTQQIIDSQNNINSSLNDSTVDSSSTSGGGFFGDFEISDDRGITSIVNAPIQFLRDLLTSNSMCTPVTFDLSMSDDNITVSNTGLTLPCGSVLWNRVPEPIQLMWTWLIYGLATYRILVDLFKFWENSINPEYTKSYIMKL